MADKHSMYSYVVNSFAVAYGVVTVQEWAAIFGVILGIATFGTNLYFKHKKENRDIEEHLLRQQIERKKLHEKCRDKPKT